MGLPLVRPVFPLDPGRAHVTHDFREAACPDCRDERRGSADIYPGSSWRIPTRWVSRPVSSEYRPPPGVRVLDTRRLGFAVSLFVD